MRAPPIQPGDRFIKLDNTSSVWVAESVLERPDLPVHVRLIRADDPHRMITLSVSALLDRRLYRRTAKV
jgi:hypothetical protein